LTCPLHGRTFGLDGRLASAPGFEMTADFPTPDDDVSELAVDNWGPMIFAGLAPAFEFETLMRPVAQHLAWLAPKTLEHEPLTLHRKVDANWSLVAAQLADVAQLAHDPYWAARLQGAPETELLALGALSSLLAAEGAPALHAPHGHRDHGRAVAASWVWLFPNLVIEAYPWALIGTLVAPLAPESTALQHVV